MSKLSHYLFILIILMSHSAYAGIVVTGTRVVYPADKAEVTVNMSNKGEHPALVQSWIDTGDPHQSPQHIKVPFVIVPPITRIDGGKGQTLRLHYTGEPVAGDRETIFWLNILAVPPKSEAAEKNYLNAAFQTRLKLFFRPVGLKPNPKAAPESLQWRTENGQLVVHNPTPYHISLVSVADTHTPHRFEQAGEMVAPFSSLTLTGKKVGVPSGVNKLAYSTVGDMGEVLEFEKVVNN